MYVLNRFIAATRWTNLKKKQENKKLTLEMYQCWWRNPFDRGYFSSYLRWINLFFETSMSCLSLCNLVNSTAGLQRRQQNFEAIGETWSHAFETKLDLTIRSLKCDIEMYPWPSCGNAGNVFHPRVSNPDIHNGTCVMHVPWCMPGSLTSGFIWSRWRGKRSRHSRRMRNPQFLRIW